MARAPSTYRGARKAAVRSAGEFWRETGFQKITLRRPTPSAKGKALPLKAIDGDGAIVPTKTPGKYEPAPQPAPGSTPGPKISGPVGFSRVSGPRVSRPKTPATDAPRPSGGNLVSDQKDTPPNGG